jgi:hypothetical protein
MDRTETTQVRRDLWGMWRTSVLSTFVSSGVADVLTEAAQSVAALASATANDPGAVYRLLRCAVAMGYAQEAVSNEESVTERRFASTPRGDLLRTDAPGSLHALALMYNSEWQHAAWQNLGLGVRSGSGVLEQVLGKSLYAYLAERPDDSQTFNRAMTALTANMTDELAAAYDFSGVTTVLDVGGGQGTFLAALLHHHPHLNGVLVDQPHVIDAANRLLAGQGLSDRCRTVPGSFFTDLPRVEADTVVTLKSILHNWKDAEATRILRAIRDAMPSGGRLLIIEPVLAEHDWDEDQVLLDLGMLILSNGLERTLNEHQKLLDAADFDFVRHIPVLPLASMIEAAAR